jgi:hypothetical protein
MLTVFGACAVTFMMVMYALESRGRAFVLAFSVGCALSSAYGFMAGTWPFGVVEAVWSLVALKRYRGQASAAARRQRSQERGEPIPVVGVGGDRKDSG